MLKALGVMSVPSTLIDQFLEKSSSSTFKKSFYFHGVF